jgi:transposase
MQPRARRQARRKRGRAQSPPHRAPRLKPTHLNAAGIDVGTTQHWVAVPADRDAQPVRPFGAFTADLYVLAEWLQELHSYGLLRGAFRPEEQVCTLRSYLRQRSLLMTSAAHTVQHMQKALEQMNMKLTEVVNDIMGKTGMGIIRAILAGERDPQRLARRRDRRCRHDTATIAKALEGHWREEHLFALQQAVDLCDFYQQQIKACEARLETCLQGFERQGEASAIPLAPSPRARQRHGHAPPCDGRAYR